MSAPAAAPPDPWCSLEDPAAPAPACPRCSAVYLAGLRAGREVIRWETVQPFPQPESMAPLARDGSGPCCRDCAAADSLCDPRAGGHPDWLANRVAVGNCRQEQLRLPGAPLGLVGLGFMRPNAPGDLERHHRWLERVLPDPDPDPDHT